MDFQLTEEQNAFADAVRRFAQATLADGALKRAHEPGYAFDVARQLAEQGLLGITMREEDGGQGGTLMDAVIAIQEVALVCPKSADVVQAGNFGPIRTFVEYASPEQKRRYLGDLLSGRKVIALGMTEPGAGSAVTELRTSARREGDEYVINGTKIFSTHSPEAELFLVYCRFGPGVDNIGSVLIEKGTPGFTVGQPSSFMSGEEWSQLYIEDCRIPAENVLLGPGGFKQQISGFNVERVGNASRALALGRHAFNIAREHALVREQFGRPLCEFQGIQWKFADMALKLEASQLLLYRAANTEPGKLPSAYDTAIAKAHCNMTGFDVANEALQIMGGMGYSQESLVEYCVRRTRGWMIAGGSIEVLKNRIAENVFDRRFSQYKK
ncbi:alkylation response protein AidB-like acyl-CoA dehydrogenase [Pseudomonas citronellolis]|uniref:acyl-CoA dehydrogenase family protein n=1 Tax=Pseudomonas citronellolis TaxID=53408 RepID=UPI0020A199BD|nr:acyl-CoA dehydrogenase [Pseudomonas citronellolis]MCP1644999.1 alkylation response protein AidB-like acyl-CoA dehydrogenase [Pseudomonas citronellolis]MCP1668001.1 alkylation response protein AidB-like acyl-CoA dehydrogenase [Pseudomonas citronellolis]MCP1699153.1 alkylation response protein AidB-like acyl-CoA dehydrogenase [Pseudomonas citronellolis]MCP1705684.1 alkylation response protein AidB-like acyl-CoA dehydrogenase [Pseudomonas citronellolis]MCP1799717.1 alkylation response protein 